MGILVEALRWAGIVGLVGWLALNVVVGYELLKEKPHLSQRGPVSAPRARPTGAA